MKVLLVEFNSAVSGAERSMLELVQGLQTEHEVILACPIGPLADRTADLGVRVLPIPASHLTFRLHPLHTPRGLARMGHAAYRLRSVIRAIRPDVVHANSTRAGLLAVPAARRMSPVVVHCRDALPQGRAGSIVRSALLEGADHVVAISRHVAGNLAGAGWATRPITVVDNAVDLDRFDPAALPLAPCRAALAIDGHVIVVSVIAQLTPWKGQELAIRTLAEMRRRGHDALLLVVGEAKFVGAATRYDNRAFERALHQLVDALGLPQFVRFLGERSDPERVLAATDVLLVPSTEEPFGRTIIEAMAMGVPVVASSVGGPSEILSDGIGGRLVHGRGAEEWADAAADLTSWPQERRAAARAAAEERFSRARHAAAMLAVYDAVLREREAPVDAE